MIPSLVTVNFAKTGGTALAVILNLLLLSSTGASGACVNVPNNEMVEYACVGGTPFDLHDIPKLAEKIRVANMSLPRVTRETFARFGDNLWVLACTHCGIREIDDDAFASLTNLQQLRLDNNRLRGIKAAWFRGLVYLTYLDLNYNEIETIEDGVYGNLPGLVDLRVSGNKLRCLNVDAISRLGGLKRIFLSHNPEFQCPNAVSRYLEEHRVAFDRDPEWSRVPQDTLPAWRFTETATPGYHEKLISRTTEEPPLRKDPVYPVYYPTYPPPSQATSERTTPPPPAYPDQGWYASSTTPYPRREWPTSAVTERVWPASMPNSHPTPIPRFYWATTTPAPFDDPPRRPDDYDTRDPDEGEIYGQTNYYPPAMMRTSTNEPIDEAPRAPYANYPRYDDAEDATAYPAMHPTAPPPLVEWVGNSAEVFTATDYAPYENEPRRETEAPEIPTASQRPAIVEESNGRAEDVEQRPKVVDEYQAIQEPNAVTVAPPVKERTNAAGSTSRFGITAAIVAICVTLRPFATIQ